VIVLLANAALAQHVPSCINGTKLMPKFMAAQAKCMPSSRTYDRSGESGAICDVLSTLSDDIDAAVCQSVLDSLDLSFGGICDAMGALTDEVDPAVCEDVLDNLDLSNGGICDFLSTISNEIESSACTDVLDNLDLSSIDLSNGGFCDILGSISNDIDPDVCRDVINGLDFSYGGICDHLSSISSEIDSSVCEEVLNSLDLSAGGICDYLSSLSDDIDSDVCEGILANLNIFNRDGCPTAKDLIMDARNETKDVRCMMKEMRWFNAKKGSFNDKLIKKDISSLPESVTANMSEESVKQCIDDKIKDLFSQEDPMNCWAGYSNKDKKMLMKEAYVYSTIICISTPLIESCEDA